VSGRIDAAAIAFSNRTCIGRHAQNFRHVRPCSWRQAIGRDDRDNFVSLGKPSPGWDRPRQGRSKNANVIFAILTAPPKVQIDQQSWTPVLNVSITESNALVSTRLAARD
jgi:hypothetical protein